MLKNSIFFIVLGLSLILISPLSSRGETLTDDNVKEHAFSLREALIRGLEMNLDLQLESLEVPAREEDVIINDAIFDTTVNASISSMDDINPSPSAFASASGGVDIQRATGGQVGLSKRFPVGLTSRLSFETIRSMNNSSIDALRPQYRDILVLDLTQPLLRDFGTGVNKAALNISNNQVDQAVLGYAMRAQRIGRDIETAYYNLANSLEILGFRKESRELAQELLKGNQKRFDAGVAPVTEVQEAETAAAAREEQVIYAMQTVETFSNQLKDLLEIRPGDPLFSKVFKTEFISAKDQEIPERDMSLGIAFEKRPDIQRQKLELENRDIRVAYLNNQKLPRVDLITTLGINGLSGGARTITFGGFPAAPSIYEGNYSDALSSMADADGYDWFVGLNFSYPLGNRAADAKLRRAEIEKRQAVYSLKSLEGNVETEVLNALVVAERSFERLEVAERTEELAEISLRQEMEKLKEGLSNTFRVLNFQTYLIDARIRKVTALTDLNKGLADLHYAMGTNLIRFDIVEKLDKKGKTYE